MRVGRLLSTAVLAGLATLAVASPAFADATLNPSHVGATASGFPGKDCGIFPNLPAGSDGWHFVLPAATSDDFVSVQLTFATPAPLVVNVTSHDPNAPSTGPGWSGYIQSAGMSGQDKHLYLTTTAGWTLTAGTAVTNPPTDTGTFNLSSTCAGTPVTPSPRPSQPGGDDTGGSPSASPSPGSSGSPGVPATFGGPGGTPGVSGSPGGGGSGTPKPSGGAETGGGGSLGYTTAGVTALAFAGAAGAFLFLARKRRDIE